SANRRDVVAATAERHRSLATQELLTGDSLFAVGETGAACMNFFFYGTLLDDDVFALVTGRSTAPHDRCRAAIHGHLRVFREGASYPILVAAAGGRVDGALVAGLGPKETERLKTFEGDEYDLVQLVVHRHNRGPASAYVFMAKTWVAGSAEEWDLAHWRRRHKRRYVARLRKLGTWTPD
ncbi:MAG: gamma-glutamylcyclotransferase family protein, partial [Hyphomicrobium sp.]